MMRYDCLLVRSFFSLPVLCSVADVQLDVADQHPSVSRTYVLGRRGRVFPFSFLVFFSISYLLDVGCNGGCFSLFPLILDAERLHPRNPVLYYYYYWFHKRQQRSTDFIQFHHAQSKDKLATGGSAFSLEHLGTCTIGFHSTHTHTHTHIHTACIHPVHHPSIHPSPPCKTPTQTQLKNND
ncbi:hypothetical protein VTJ04DRAFT_5491 [Mycothermus thermophilus]|uniref:uncharacterized protein n=1 Tax=Humicola insolens TaxID=85995 RepID=UPI0037445E4E